MSSKNNMPHSPVPRMLTYTTAIAELFMLAEGEKDKLLQAKFDALRASYARVEYYAKQGIANEITDTIMEKKAKMILDATTVQTVRELAAIPKPRYTGAEWIVSPNSVPEEEMVMWSESSLRAGGPLRPEAVERYMRLFRDFYGEKADELLGVSLE